LRFTHPLSPAPRSAGGCPWSLPIDSSKACAIRSSGQAGPSGSWSAFSRTRARVCSRAGCSSTDEFEQSRAVCLDQYHGAPFWTWDTSIERGNGSNHDTARKVNNHFRRSTSETAVLLQD
jgi:hypothetical protein